MLSKRKKTLSSIIIVLITFITIILISGCSGNNSGDIVGTWESNWDGGGGQEYEFSSDNMFTYRYYGSSENSMGLPQNFCRYRGTYTVSENTLTLDIDIDSIRTDGMGVILMIMTDEIYENNGCLERKFKFSNNGKKLIISDSNGSNEDTLSQK